MFAIITISCVVLFMGAVALIVAVLFAWEERRRVPTVLPFCSQCKYELTGLRADEKCPECACTAPRTYRPLRESPGRAAALSLCVKLPLGSALMPVAILMFWTTQTLPGRFEAASGVVLAHVALAALLRTVAQWLTPSAARRAAYCSSAPIATSSLAISIIAFFDVLAIEPVDVLTLAPAAIPLAAPGLWLAVRESLRAPWCAPPPSPTSDAPDQHAPQRWTLDRSGRVRHE